ncbi:MAG: amino acid permease [Gemmatimonadetes bacterium]|nr:amino acid permease [Gemmatimonadota bacterium]
MPEPYRGAARMVPSPPAYNAARPPMRTARPRQGASDPHSPPACTLPQPPGSAGESAERGRGMADGAWGTRGFPAAAALRILCRPFLRNGRPRKSSSSSRGSPHRPPRARMPDASASSESRLVRALGVWGLAAGIVNVTVGGGIFRLPSGVAGSLGATGPVAYLVCALAMALIVLCFAEAGSRVALTGGPYAYVEVAFGPFVGFLSGILLWVVGSLALAAVATIFADALGGLVPALHAPAARAALLIAIFALLAGVNVRGVRQGTRLNTIATVAKLLPLLVLLVGGAFAVHGANLVWPAPPQPANIARTSVLLIFAFMGIESALVPSGEVRDPARTVPRALFLAMGAVTLLYVGLHVVAQGVLGASLAGRSTPLADAAGQALGPWGARLLLAGATVSMFGYVSGMTLAVPRALFALGRDGFLPRVLASVHPTWRTPHVAIAVQSAIACVLAITSGFERLAILANLATLLLYAGCCAAAWELRRRDVRAGGTPFRVPGGAIAPVAALGVIAWLLTSITRQEWAVVGAVLVLAALAYLASRGTRARIASSTQVHRAGTESIDRP